MPLRADLLQPIPGPAPPAPTSSTTRSTTRSRTRGSRTTTLPRGLGAAAQGVRFRTGREARGRRARVPLEGSPAGGVAHRGPVASGRLLRAARGSRSRVRPAPAVLRTTCIPPSRTVMPSSAKAARLDGAVAGAGGPLGPLTASGYDFYRYKESRAVGTELDAAGDAKKLQARQQAIGDGKLPAEEFDKAFAATPKAWYKAVAEYRRQHPRPRGAGPDQPRKVRRGLAQQRSTAGCPGGG